MGYPCDSNYETHLGWLAFTAWRLISSLVTAAMRSSTTPSQRATTSSSIDGYSDSRLRA